METGQARRAAGGGMRVGGAEGRGGAEGGGERGLLGHGI